jgi:hypothetical protein
MLNLIGLVWVGWLPALPGAATAVNSALAMAADLPARFQPIKLAGRWLRFSQTPFASHAKANAMTRSCLMLVGLVVGLLAALPFSIGIYYSGVYACLS